MRSSKVDSSTRGTRAASFLRNETLCYNFIFCQFVRNINMIHVYRTMETWYTGECRVAWCTTQSSDSLQTLTRRDTRHPRPRHPSPVYTTGTCTLHCASACVRFTIVQLRRQGCRRHRGSPVGSFFVCPLTDCLSTLRCRPSQGCDRPHERGCGPANRCVMLRRLSLGVVAVAASGGVAALVGRVHQGSRGGCA